MSIAPAPGEVVLRRHMLHDTAMVDISYGLTTMPTFDEGGLNVGLMWAISIVAKSFRWGNAAIRRQLG